MLATMTLIGFLAGAPVSLPAAEGVEGVSAGAAIAAAATIGRSYPADSRCRDAVGEGLSGALQIDAGDHVSGTGPSQGEPNAVPESHDCALV